MTSGFRKALQPGQTRQQHGFDPEYLAHCVKVAPIIHGLRPVALFAEHFVALEASVSTWYGFFHYQLLDRGQFRILSGLREAGIDRAQVKAADLLASWTASGYPWLSDEASERAWSRRHHLALHLGLPVGSGSTHDATRGPHERQQHERCRQWVLDGQPGPDRDRRLANVDAWIASYRSKRPAASGQWDGCRAVFEHHGDRPCVLCAIPFKHSLVEGRPQYDSAGWDARGRRRGRLARSVVFLQRLGWDQQASADREDAALD